ncbi:hypothetical protein [Acinetobacter johnsonii]|uniref:hypothetical protein n=1 Tax=Acinetobacter johnsonii TaxID=40214 RepID=UPI002448E2F6|nr:hypothetical protein [Acinetobacter johnsonii]MDH1706013.1 hypothetical protein [Acinetobacter johnsonii]
MYKILKEPIYCLYFLILITIMIYIPGLKAGFLFDDISNLGEMGRYGDLHQWENAKNFISNGIAGPTGRPISLLTFVPQYGDWLSANALPFKVVNLVIHLLCGGLLYWVICLLLRSYGEIKEQKIKWVALLATSIWLLHPLMLSTTLYVIQRMAQLPLLFSLLAMIGYFKGRALVNAKPYFAYTLMTLSIGLGTILATFSKENGALLPLLILVIEFCNPNKNNNPTWQWRTICLWLPSLAILAVLARYIDLSPDPWAMRSFNQIERLLTEGRVMMDYINQLFIPRIEGYGLFQDGYLISKGWLSPPSTLFSILFLLFLFIGALLSRKKYPLIALAILFFFAAHLMESTVIGLELYFEHRNYIAAIFLFLPLAAGIYTLSECIKPSVVVFISILILTFLSMMTWQRAVLWSDENKLMLYWAQNSPNSPRAQSVIAELLARSGDYEEANNIVEQALKKRPESGLLSIQLLSQKIKAGTASQQDFILTNQQTISHRADTQAAIAIRDLIFYTLKQPKVIEKYGDDLLNILNTMLQNNSYLRIKDFQSYAIYLQGRILTLQNKPDLAYQHFSKALTLSRDVEEGLNMVITLGNAGYLQYALKLLQLTEFFLKTQPEKSIKKSNTYYNKVIKQTRHDMLTDLNAGLNKVMP